MKDLNESLLSTDGFSNLILLDKSKEMREVRDQRRDYYRQT